MAAAALLSVARQPSRTALFAFTRSLGTAPTPPRHHSFDKINAQHISALKQIVGGDANCFTDATSLAAYNADWTGRYRGSSQLALRPPTPRAVADALKYCTQHGLAVVPQGGNTGLVGGGVPVYDEVVISTAALNAVESVDADSGCVVAGAGVVLQALDEELAKHNLMVPLDLGAKGSCHIGGNVSTNAGGLRYLRYGSLHGSVLGLEVALADGTLLDLLSTCRKDNTGYDLKQLFIGAEGTLGIVTRVALQAAPRPSSVQAAWIGIQTFEDVRRALRLARRHLGETLSAFEFVDRASLDVVLEGQHASMRLHDPLPDNPTPFHALVEVSGSNEAHDTEKLEHFLEAASEEGIAVDGTVASGGRQLAELWAIREGISEALARRGAPVYKYDVSIPLSCWYDIVTDMRARLSEAGYSDSSGVRVVGYGHMGDANMHLNISSLEVDDRIGDLIEPWVYEWVSSRGGSISAEHGLGQMKASAIGYSKHPEAVRLMAQIKDVLDPSGTLNPYKVLPSPTKL